MLLPKNLNIIKTVVVVFAAAALISNCGYRLAKYENPLLEGINSIAVPYFQNKTFEAEAVPIFTNAFVSEFVKGKRLTISNTDEADIVLYGRVKELRKDIIARDWDDKANAYRIYAAMDITLEERKTGKVLYKRNNLFHTEEYPVRSDIAFSEAAKRDAFQKIASDLAQRVHDSIMQGF